VARSGARGGCAAEQADRRIPAPIRSMALPTVRCAPMRAATRSEMPAPKAMRTAIGTNARPAVVAEKSGGRPESPSPTSAASTSGASGFALASLAPDRYPHIVASAGYLTDCESPNSCFTRLRRDHRRGPRPIPFLTPSRGGRDRVPVSGGSVGRRRGPGRSVSGRETWISTTAVHFLPHCAAAPQFGRWCTTENQSTGRPPDRVGHQFSGVCITGSAGCAGDAQAPRGPCSTGLRPAVETRLRAAHHDPE
jgi:hypothetical protein